MCAAVPHRSASKPALAIFVRGSCAFRGGALNQKTWPAAFSNYFAVWVRGATLFATLMLPSSGRAQEAGAGAPVDAKTVADLLKRLEFLEVRVGELQKKLDATTVNAASPVPVAAPSAAAVSGREISSGSNPLPVSEEPQNDTSSKRVQLRIFGDVGYGVSDQKGEANSFHIGSLDLFMTGNLSERVSVLGEVLFIPQHDNTITPDVERLLLQFKYNDYFNFAVGRYHSSIGYYNTAFHQGAWFQTAIDRPFMYAFDDQEGFLPLQEVGITTSGQIPSGQLGLNYVIETGNGRSHLLGSDPAQNTQDENNGKSVNLALFSRPGWLPGFQMGFSLYHDYITFPDNLNHSELISTVHAVYVNSNYEFLNEAMLVRHDRTRIGMPGVFHTSGFYTQVSRRFGKYRPYFRYSYLNASVDDPIYGDPADGPLVGRRNGPTFGLRFDFNDHAAFKLQYDHLDRRGQKATNGLETQFSFAF
jgi:hypothetical protein